MNRAYLESLSGRPVELANEARPEAVIEDLRRVLETELVGQAVAVADVIIVSIGYNVSALLTVSDRY